MRRSKCPSQQAKQSNSKLPSFTKDRKRKDYAELSNSDEDDEDGPSTKKIRAPLQELSRHETFIRALLTLKKPFKVPIPGYQGESSSRKLGFRRGTGKRALHDPDEPGALILYSPPELPPGVISTDSVSFTLKDRIIFNGLLT